MKKVYITFVLVLLTLTTHAVMPGETEIKDLSIKKRGEQVFVTFSMDKPELSANTRITFDPYIYKGDQRLELTPFTLTGRNKYVTDKRSGFVPEGTYVRNNNKMKVIDYSVVVDWQDWMDNISVKMNVSTEDCCMARELPEQLIVEDKLLYYEIVPSFDTTPLEYELTELEKYDLENPFLHPTEDIEKRYDILLKDRDKGSSVVYFKVGSHIIDPDFQGNKDILAAIAKALEIIEADPNATLKLIMVAGYASPEGSLAFNTRLAQNRAESVKKFLESKLTMRTNDAIFELYNGREDWNGLRDLVNKSYMPEKDTIISIIDSYTMEQEQRKTVLKTLYKGEPYKYMLEHFYPPLRNAGYVQVYYEIDRRATIPAAVTDEFGRTTWLDPDSPQNKDITKINKAISAMQSLNFDEALELLLQTEEHAKVPNLLGVCYMMKGDYDTARHHFHKAIELGDLDAGRNIKEIEIIETIE